MKEEFVKIRNEMEAVNQQHHHYLVDKVSMLKKNLFKVEISKHKLASQYKRKLFELQKVFILNMFATDNHLGCG